MSFPGAIGFGTAGPASHLAPSQADTAVTLGHQPNKSEFYCGTKKTRKGIFSLNYYALYKGGAISVGGESTITFTSCMMISNSAHQRGVHLLIFRCDIGEHVST